jgi:hypothetical protein
MTFIQKNLPKNDNKDTPKPRPNFFLILKNKNLIKVHAIKNSTNLTKIYKWKPLFRSWRVDSKYVFFLQTNLPFGK